jgi:hypothetical protein
LKANTFRSKEVRIFMSCTQPDDTQISYSPISVSIHFVLTAAILILFSFGLSHSIQHHKTIGIYFCIAWLLVFFYPATIYIKTFIAFVLKKPAIVLTKDFYRDNVQNIIIPWGEIKDIRITTLKVSFLTIAVKNNSVIYKQVQNPIKKFFMWSNTFSGKPLMTNLSLLKGKNKDILNIVKEFNPNNINN